MSIQVETDSKIMREANQILLTHMPPSKWVRFWASWQRGSGDYLAWRDEEFAGMTVDQLYADIVSEESTDPIS